MLSHLLTIFFKFSRTNKKVVISSFCCLSFLNYSEKGLSLITRLMPKASLRLLKNN